MKGRLVRFGFAAVVLTVPVAFLASDALDKRSNCEKATEWARKHRADLPATYVEIATFPLAHRIYIFDGLRPDQKVSVWKERLSGVLSRPELTERQRAIVQRAHDVLEPGLYTAPSIAPLSGDPYGSLPPRYAGILKDAQRAFADTEFREIFFQLGDRDDGSYSYTGLRALSVNLAADLQRLLSVAAASCVCRYDIGCGSGNICVINGTCTDTSSGCGPWGSWACVGKCSASNDTDGDGIPDRPFEQTP